MEQDTEFDDAFAEVETTAANPVDLPAEPEADAPTVDAPVEDVPADVPPADSDVPAPAADAPAPAAPAEPAAPVLDPKYLAQAIAEANEQIQASKTPPAPVETPKEAEFTDFLSEQDKTALEVFKSEWSEVAAPVTALINAHVKAALANQEKQILSRVERDLAPIQQITAQSQVADHMATIKAAHPDFQEVAAALPAWIEKQPALFQPALRQAYEKGTTAQVVELLSTYKQAIGSTGAAPAQPASSAAQVTPQPAPVNKAALAATLAPPAAQRSSQSPARDPNDFEAAFNEGL